MWRFFFNFFFLRFLNAHVSGYIEMGTLKMYSWLTIVWLNLQQLKGSSWGDHLFSSLSRVAPSALEAERLLRFLWRKLFTQSVGAARFLFQLKSKHTYLDDVYLIHGKKIEKWNTILCAERHSKLLAAEKKKAHKQRQNYIFFVMLFLHYHAL